MNVPLQPNAELHYTMYKNATKYNIQKWIKIQKEKARKKQGNIMQQQESSLRNQEGEKP